MRRLCFLAGALLALTMTAVPAVAEQPQWRSFDSLVEVDRATAESALADNFGGDPSLWPDWLDPAAVRLPMNFTPGTLLVVRQPLHAACGEFGFTVFGPRASDGSRRQWGGLFCAGRLEVVPAPWQRAPDLRFLDGRRRDPATGAWVVHDATWHWTGSDWVEQ